MSHSRQTEHYNLPLYNGTDIINPLTDFNDANDAIDTALYNANQSASSANTKADSAVAAVAGYDERITAAENKADSALTKNSDTEKMIANEFDPLKDGGYAIGDSVIYNDKLYTFINPHTGAWDAGDVVNQPITDAVKSTIAAGKTEIEQETQDAIAEIATQTQKVTATQKMIAPAFDPNKVGGYAVDDRVTYADKLYKFNDAHTGAWLGTDVTEIDVESELEAIDLDRMKEMRYRDIAELNTEAGATWSAVWQAIYNKIVEIIGTTTRHSLKVDLSYGTDEDSTVYDVYWGAGYLHASTMRGGTNASLDVNSIFVHESTIDCHNLHFTTTGMTATDSSSDVQPARHIKIYELVN